MLESISSWAAAIAAIAAVFVAYINYKRQISPLIVMYLEKDKDLNFVYLVIKNIGNGVAFDVRYDIGELSVDLSDKEEENEDIKKRIVDLGMHGVEILSPDSEIRWPIFTFGRCALCKDDNLQQIKANVKYRNKMKKTRFTRDINQDYYLDLFTFSKIVCGESLAKKLLDNLSGINNGIKNINNKMN